METKIEDLFLELLYITLVNAKAKMMKYVREGLVELKTTETSVQISVPEFPSRSNYTDDSKENSDQDEPVIDERTAALLALLLRSKCNKPDCKVCNPKANGKDGEQADDGENNTGPSSSPPYTQDATGN